MIKRARRGKGKAIPRPMTGEAEDCGHYSTRVVWASRGTRGGGRFVIGDARYYRLVPKRRSHK